MPGVISIKSMKPKTPPAVALRLLSLLLLALWLAGPAQAGAGRVSVPLPNGYLNVSAEDLRLQSAAGAVSWKRHWDGEAWTFNGHWESLSQSWKNLTCDRRSSGSGSPVAGTWHYDANNRLTDRGILFHASRYAYDTAGNLIRRTESGNVTRYVYDTQNRLIEVQDGSDHPIARYGYDPFHRRIWKEQYRDKNGRPLTQPERTYSLYADEGLIAESRQPIALKEDQTVSASTEPAIASQYGPRPDAPFTTGILFAKTRNTQGEDIFAYYHHDHLQTPILATDKHGNVVWSARHDAFGRATLTTPTATPELPTIHSHLRLPGQIEDRETGLHYNWHRYYDPDLGRYITRDPIGLEGGINPYAYVGGDPVNRTDPTGQILWVPVAYRVARGVLVLWTLYELINDVNDTAEVFSDPCASHNDKLAALGWFVLGAVDRSPGDLGRKVARGKGLGNPFKDKSAKEIDQMFKDT